MVSASYEKKTAAIRGEMIPKALYGCEVASVCNKTIHRLGSAILKMINPSDAMRSRDFTFVTCSRGTDVDPDANILLRRIMALRMGSR